MDFWDAENAWYREAPVSRLAKAIAQYEIVKSVIELPGAFAEFGVFKAASLVRLATYRDLLEPAGSRQIYGFDAFGSFPETADPEDREWIAQWELEAGDGLPKSEVLAVLERKGFENVELFEGDIRATLPAFLDSQPDVRFALVHVDVDVEDVTRPVLELCAERIVPGGVFMLDDYKHVEGATRATDAFTASRSDFTFEDARFVDGRPVLRRTA